MSTPPATPSPSPQPTPLPGTDDLGAPTVFVTDLAGEAGFCQEVLGLPVIAADEQSVLFALGGTALNLLAVEHAGELVTLPPASRSARARR